MTVLILHSLRRDLTHLFICGRRNLVSGTQNNITLWGMIKVYWTDYSLHFGSCCLLRFCHKFGPKLASHYKPVNKRSILHRTVRTMFGELNVRLSSIKKRSIVHRTVQTMLGEQKLRLSSIKKRSIVRRTVRSMIGELTVRPVKNGFKRHARSHLTWASSA